MDLAQDCTYIAGIGPRYGVVEVVWRMRLGLGCAENEPRTRSIGTTIRTTHYPDSVEHLENGVASHLRVCDDVGPKLEIHKLSIRTAPVVDGYN